MNTNKPNQPDGQDRAEPSRSEELTEQDSTQTSQSDLIDSGDGSLTTFLGRVAPSFVLTARHTSRARSLLLCVSMK